MAFFTEIEKTVWKSQIAKAILEKEKNKQTKLKGSHFWVQLILQSANNQNSMALAWKKN